MHVRQKIRDEIYNAVSGLTTTGTNVFKSRTYPVDTTPCLLVYTGDEYHDNEESRVARLQNRNCNIVVTGKSKMSAGVDDQLDTIAEEVETAIFNASFETINTIDLESIEVEVDGGAEKPTGEIIITFSVHYLTSDGAPSTTT